jgi:hypothetical protein
MIRENELIFINNFGVSKVININSDQASIKPLYGTTGIITINLESQNLRPILTKEEIDDMIIRCHDEKTFWISKFITRADRYSQIRSSNDPYERLVMLKTIYNQHLYRISHHLKGGLSTRDLEFFHRSLDLLTYEFSTALNISYSEVPSYIAKLLNSNVIFEYYKL